MKARFLITVFGICLAGLIQACQNSSEQNEEGATENESSSIPELETADGNSLLFEITGNGLETPSYLFGTIHLIGPDDFFLPEGAEAALEISDRLVLEIDMDDPGLIMDVASITMMEGDTTIDMLLSDEEYELVDNFLKDQSGMGLALMKSFKPFFIAGMLAETYLDDYVQYEQELMDMVKEQDKEVFGLEGIDFLDELISQIPLDEQADLLVEGVVEYDETKEIFAQLIGLYKEQDVEALNKMVSEEMVEFAKFEELLLDTRNAYWMESMIPMMNEAPSFFAVGAGHLGGDKGLLVLLSEAGYNIRPLK